jgi:CobQ-like glutamine amidotransferase family enzyme
MTMPETMPETLPDLMIDQTTDLMTELKRMKPIRIAHLYPDLLNLYGDKGNLITLQKRLTWRGIECLIDPIGLDSYYDPELYDLTFMGGGQDYEQSLLYADLINQKGPAIREAVMQDRVFLCICGGYQLMGQYYRTHDGTMIECLGIMDLYTEAGSVRLIGDIVCESPVLTQNGYSGRLFGFENHSGRTRLGSAVSPLATVIRGFGNNGEDQTEGAIYRNVYCTYSHGSFLPKNPDMADYLIVKAVQRRLPDFQRLPEIDNAMENNARRFLETCIK